jgi:hypothetical protein
MRSCAFGSRGLGLSSWQIPLESDDEYLAVQLEIFSIVLVGFL